MRDETLLGNKYRLRSLLGEGAMGAVWAAVNIATDRPVAVKVVSGDAARGPEIAARLRLEAKACGRIDHPNVVQIHDAGETDEGLPFLVMQLLSGETLESKLKREGKLAPREAARIGADIARGLAAAHALHIVHRDLKPANVFLHHEAGSEQPVVKLLDFGISKVLMGGAGPDTKATATGIVLGSPAYMSPEQAKSANKVDARSDLWALGVVLHEMVTGELPFQGETGYEVVAEILRGRIPSLAEKAPGVDPRLVQLVASCLVRDPTARLASAPEAARALDAIAHGPVTSVGVLAGSEEDEECTEVYQRRPPARAPIPPATNPPATTLVLAGTEKPPAAVTTVPEAPLAAAPISPVAASLSTPSPVTSTTSIVFSQQTIALAPVRQGDPKRRWLMPAMVVFAGLLAAGTLASALLPAMSSPPLSASSDAAPTADPPAAFTSSSAQTTPGGATQEMPLTPPASAPATAVTITTAPAASAALVSPPGTSTLTKGRAPRGPVSKPSTTSTFVPEPLPTGKY